MAKTSVVARETKKRKLVARFAEKRTKLRLLAKKGDVDAQVALDKMPRDSARTRLHNRCKLTGRPKGYIRKFGICRVIFRQMASDGKIPGVTKASW